MTEPIAFARSFVLQRDRDISGVSGTGIIADGVVFPDGHAAIHWRGKWALTTPHPDGIDSILGIHDHGGQGDLHVIWADQDEQRREFAADVAEAFDVPGWVAGPEAEREVLRRQLARALTAEHKRRASEQVVASPEEHCAGFADAAMTVVDEVLGQRARWRRAVVRAYRLVYRWGAAHGSASFLVRAAGAELRDELDGVADQTHATLKVDASSWERAVARVRQDNLDDETEPDHSRSASSCSNPDHACGTCGECHDAPHGERTNRSDDQAHGFLLPHQLREDTASVADEPTRQAGRIADTLTTPVRCPLCPIAVPLATPEQAIGHFQLKHPEQRLNTSGPWPLLVSGDGATTPATTCGARYTGVLPVGECIRAAGHSPVTDHTDDRGRNFGDRSAEYPDVTIASRENGDIAGLVIKPYTEHGQKKWVFRCWGTGTCDGWVSLDHPSQQSAEQARGRHVAEEHPKTTVTVRLDNSRATFTPWPDLGSNDSQACPYCPGGAQRPRQQLRAHVESTHARVLAALARGVSLDELLHGTET